MAISIILSYSLNTPLLSGACEGIMTNQRLTNSATAYTLTDSSIIHESPFIETDGLLIYKEECKNPEFLNSSFFISLFGETVTIDHYVLLFPDTETLTEYANSLVSYHAKITEGPGRWPDDFCEDGDLFSEDLGMYFLSALMPSGVIIVLVAPDIPDEKLDCLYKQKGANAVHHVAIRVDDIYTAAQAWEKKGFRPLSVTPQNDGSLCQWFLSNEVGQIVEIISRPSAGKETFSCENIVGLRLSELEA